MGWSLPIITKKQLIGKRGVSPMHEKKIYDGLLEQIIADLEVRESAELAVMQAEGDRIIADAMAQKQQLLIIHQRIGNREKLEAFLCHAYEIRQIPAIHKNFLKTEITENFEGVLELRLAGSNSADAEAAFRNAILESNPFFDEIVATEEEGTLVLRAYAKLFGLVARSEPF